MQECHGQQSWPKSSDLHQCLLILEPAGSMHEFPECSNRLTHNASRPSVMPPKLSLTYLESNAGFSPWDSSQLSHVLIE